MTLEPVIADRPERERYEIDVGGEAVGLLTYRLGDGAITFLHAEIDPAYERRGLGSTLARHALDDAAARGLRVVPRCPFVADFVARHHDEYGDLVA